MTKIKNLYGLILAGGFSRRMGQDKALMVYHGKPQIEYVHELLSIHCEQVFLSKRVDQLTHKEIVALDDTQEFSGIGPLGGILSAMNAYPDVAWLVMACDLPFVTQDTLSYLIENRNSKKIATAFKSTQDGLPEPLCAVWETHAYPVILEFLRKDIRCPRKILINKDSCIIKQDNPRWLDNVNNAQEYKEAITYFKQ